MKVRKKTGYMNQVKQGLSEFGSLRLRKAATSDRESWRMTFARAMPRRRTFS